MNWTTEKLRELSPKALPNLRENALARNGSDVVQLIDRLSETPLQWTESHIASVGEQLKKLPLSAKTKLASVGRASLVQFTL